MTILGIDPGTKNCGYAIIQKDRNGIKLIEAGLIKIKEKILQFQIVELVEGLDIIFKILQEFGNFHEYTPLQIKKAVTGNGKAKKEQVAFMVKRILGIKQEIKPLDITDAIAIALTYANSVKVSHM